MKNLLGLGLDMKILNTLSGLGTSGSNSQHCHRDLLLRLPKPKLGTMHRFKIYLEHSVFGVSEAVSGIVWPHELFSNLYHHHRDAFFTYMVPSLEILKDFWGQVRSTPPHHILHLSCLIDCLTIHICFRLMVVVKLAGLYACGCLSIYIHAYVLPHNTYPARGGEVGRFSSSTK